MRYIYGPLIRFVAAVRDLGHTMHACISLPLTHHHLPPSSSLPSTVHKLAREAARGDDDDDDVDVCAWVRACVCTISGPPVPDFFIEPRRIWRRR
jgi:hypothetical protein